MILKYLEHKKDDIFSRFDTFRHLSKGNELIITSHKMF